MPDTHSKQTNINNDLGLGTRVAEKSRARFLNRDGTFNVRRTGQRWREALSPYHALLTMSWPRYYAMVLLTYSVTNLLFAAGYVLCGDGALVGGEALGIVDRFVEAFFFSVQTLATIGYGRISPHGWMPNLLVSVEALVGLLGFAMVTGLLFARFSRPSAKLLFSERAVIAPYKDMTAFEVRLVNARSNQMIEINATLTFSRTELINGKKTRKFYGLSLERKSVVFMPLHWVIVHPIDSQSPLHGVSEAEFETSDPEFIILITGTDETFAQMVHARTSYKQHEIVWGAKYSDIYIPNDDGQLTIDMRLLSEIENT